MTEQEFLRLAANCDAVLAHPSATLEWVAVPRLHVISEHPVHLAKYERMAELVRAEAPSGIRAREGEIAQAAGHLRNLVRAGVQGLLRRSGRDRCFGDADVLLVSGLINSDHLESAADFYFGDLQSRLAERGVRSLLALRNQTGHAYDGLSMRAWRAGVTARVLLPDVSTVASERRFILQGRVASRRLRSTRLVKRPQDGGNLWPEVVRMLRATDVVSNLRLYAQIRELCETVRPRLVITLFEGHAWERCVWHAARLGWSRTVCAGYQHSVLLRHSHAVRRSLGVGYDPDLILTAGERNRGIMEASYPGTPVVALGNSRTARLHAAGPRDAGSGVLVVPEGLEREALVLLQYALECARRHTQLRFTIRLHPQQSIERLRKLMPQFDPPPPNVEVSQGRQLEEDLERSAYLIYRGTSTVLNGVFAGLKPLYLSRDGEMDIDPLYELDAWRERVSSVEDFTAARDAHIQRPMLDMVMEWRAATSYCERYVQSVSDHAIDETLRLTLIDGKSKHA